jgi:hypothetical protein
MRFERSTIPLDCPLKRICRYYQESELHLEFKKQVCEVEEYALCENYRTLVASHPVRNINDEFKKVVL